MDCGPVLKAWLRASWQSTWITITSLVRSLLGCHVSHKNHIFYLCLWNLLFSTLHTLTDCYLLLQGVEYKIKVDEALEEALEIISSGSWKTEIFVNEDVVQSRQVSKYGKVFKFVGKIKITPQKVIHHLFYNIESMPEWNPTIKQIKVLQKIDSYTDIVYVVATNRAGGIVASRDFVVARMLENRGGSIINAMVSVTHPSMPLQAKHVRGEHGPSVYVFSPVDGSTCHLQWLLNTNLKGWLPQYLVDQTMAHFMFNYVNHLRDYTRNGMNNTEE
ncbi:steroidogenic acute regulatory protein-like [Tachypleus tridentatus]|uniref:steroidogenic acute regulatory protein-like n=1 Tax=Tachypleus tridentatus TaxID=6853 RepID=UPI003FD5157E